MPGPSKFILSDDTRRSLRGEETDTQLSYHDMGPDTPELEWMKHLSDETWSTIIHEQLNFPVSAEREARMNADIRRTNIKLGRVDDQNHPLDVDTDEDEDQAIRREMAEELPQPKSLQPGGAADAPSREVALEGLTLIEDEDPGGPNLPKPSPRRQLRLVHKARLEFIYPDGSIVEIPEGEYNDYEHIQRTMYEQAKWQQACDWAKAPDDADIVAPHILEAEAQWAGEQAAMEKWEADNHKHDTVERR